MNPQIKEINDMLDCIINELDKRDNENDRIEKVGREKSIR